MREHLAGHLPCRCDLLNPLRIAKLRLSNLNPVVVRFLSWFKILFRADNPNSGDESGGEGVVATLVETIVLANQRLDLLPAQWAELNLVVVDPEPKSRPVSAKGDVASTIGVEANVGYAVARDWNWDALEVLGIAEPVSAGQVPCDAGVGRNAAGAKVFFGYIRMVPRVNKTPAVQKVSSTDNVRPIHLEAVNMPFTAGILDDQRQIFGLWEAGKDRKIFLKGYIVIGGGGFYRGGS